MPFGAPCTRTRGVDPPFTIFLPLSKPHPPYSTSEPFYSTIDPAELPPLRPAGSGKPDYHALIKSYVASTPLNCVWFASESCLNWRQEQLAPARSRLR